jgi:signal transduction histidine kinase
MTNPTDEHIAAALAAAQGRISDQVRAEADRALRALVDAFGRVGGARSGAAAQIQPRPCVDWRSWPRQPCLISSGILRDGRLVGRLVETVSEMALIVVASERANSDKQTHELRELLEAKDDYLHLAVHELRGPLGRIAGYLSMIGDGDLGALPDSARQAVESASADAQRMAGLLDRLAAVARLEDHAHLRPRRSPCKIGDVLTAAIAGAHVEASAKRIRLEHHVADLDLEVTGDADQLRTAVGNLLSNAVKYAPEGSTVTVRAATRHGGVAIVVSDQGPGIEPADAPLVFEKHYRASSTAPGLGLGLYLVRRIVELHGGLVTLDSEPGRGATFTILLPAS